MLQDPVHAEVDVTLASVVALVDTENILSKYLFDYFPKKTKLFQSWQLNMVWICDLEFLLRSVIFPKIQSHLSALKDDICVPESKGPFK